MKNHAAGYAHMTSDYADRATPLPQTGNAVTPQENRTAGYRPCRICEGQGCGPCGGTGSRPAAAADAPLVDRSDGVPIYIEDAPTARVRKPAPLRSPALDRVALQAAGVVAGEPGMADTLALVREIFEVTEDQIVEERPLVHAEDVPEVPRLPPPPLPVGVHRLPPPPRPAIAAPRRAWSAALLVLLLLVLPGVALAGAPETGGHQGGHQGPNHGGTTLEPQLETEAKHPPPDGPNGWRRTGSKLTKAEFLTRLCATEQQGVDEPACLAVGLRRTTVCEMATEERAAQAAGVPGPAWRVVPCQPAPPPLGKDPPANHFGVVRELAGCQAAPGRSSWGALLLVVLALGALRVPLPGARAPREVL